MGRRKIPIRMTEIPMDPVARIYLFLTLDGGLEFLHLLRESLGPEKPKLMDLFDPLWQLTADERISKTDLVDYGHAVGTFAGAATALRVTISSLLLELDDHERSGQLAKWRNEMLESVT
jgi:hypothetical protein